MHELYYLEGTGAAPYPEAVLAIRPGRPWPTQTRAWPTQMKIPRTAPAPTPYLIGGTTIFECFRNSWELRDCVLIKGSMRQLRLIYDLNDNLLL